MSTVALPAGHNVCHNHMSYTYTGNECTPWGLGYCAEAEEIGKVMTGRDKRMYKVGIDNAMKVWVRIGFPTLPLHLQDTAVYKRAPSAYNIFIKEKMAELRVAEPGLQPKEYMSKAAAAYRESKQ